MNEWWQKAVVYQIYPRSFSDSTNNGIGDLRGIINKLDYIRNLGIDAIWFNPFFPSPQADFGYDISDYEEINPEYGTMDDFDELLNTAHSLNMKIILDMVLNHTSDQHPWFLESRSSKNNSKREWYVWKDGKGKNKRKPPNNWKAVIGGSMWELDEQTDQYYLHQFLPCQPDLNWRNQEVQEAMFNAMQFWLDKGADGFRLDIIHTLFEDIEFRNNPRSKQLLPSHDNNANLLQNPIYTQFLSETINMCTRLRKLIDSYEPTRVLIGEAFGGPKIYRSLYGENNDGLNLVFNFKLGDPPFSARKIRNYVNETEELLPIPIWPCIALSNHDVPRMISRYGNDERKARLMVLLLLTLRCTPVIYYGEEIGMRQVKVPKQYVKDPIANLKIFRLPFGSLFGRDGCRTPMQWTNNHKNAGFSSDPNINPWLPIDSLIDSINVETQTEAKDSMLYYYKSIIHFRKSEETLMQGSLDNIIVSNKHCLMYERNLDNNGILIVLNFSKKQINITNPRFSSSLLFSTHRMKIKEKNVEQLLLEPYEGLLLKY
ncbi:MAG: alpha-amylase family glycosyl hydrolase [Candidatus Hodarchaeales archaeon]|jgi:alpha-glucosidase